MVELVQQFGAKKWSVIASHLKGRIGKQCRERWHNHLNPDIKKCSWTPQEDDDILRLHRVYGNQWAKIAKHIPGRWVYSESVDVSERLDVCGWVFVLRTYRQMRNRGLIKLVLFQTEFSGNVLMCCKM